MPLNGTLKENYARMINPSIQINEFGHDDVDPRDPDYDPRFQSDPAIIEVAEKLADEFSRRINTEAERFPKTGATIYAAQGILEEVIKILESRV